MQSRAGGPAGFSPRQRPSRGTDDLPQARWTSPPRSATDLSTAAQSARGDVSVVSVASSVRGRPAIRYEPSFELSGVGDDSFAVRARSPPRWVRSGNLRAAEMSHSGTLPADTLPEPGRSPVPRATSPKLPTASPISGRQSAQRSSQPRSDESAFYMLAISDLADRVERLEHERDTLLREVESYRRGTGDALADLHQELRLLRESLSSRHQEQTSSPMAARATDSEERSPTAEADLSHADATAAMSEVLKQERDAALQEVASLRAKLARAEAVAKQPAAARPKLEISKPTEDSASSRDPRTPNRAGAVATPLARSQQHASSTRLAGARFAHDAVVDGLNERAARFHADPTQGQ